MKRKMQSFAQQTSLDGKLTVSRNSKYQFFFTHCFALPLNSVREIFVHNLHPLSVFYFFVYMGLTDLTVSSQYCSSCLTCSKFTMLTASQQALKNGLSLEVDRLGELIDKLENKVLLFDEKY